MGNKVATFTEQQLEDYQDCTFFTRKEILTIFQRYRDLDPKRIPHVMTGNESHTLTVSAERIEKMPELKENPFKRRICEVFSHDGSGNMTFDDFLDMLNVFSESAPRDLKVYYAFKIYDYDGDHFITAYDIEQTTIALTRNELTPDEIQDVCDRVIEEANNDDDGVVSLAEFQAVISRSPDFLSTFHVRI